MSKCEARKKSFNIRITPENEPINPSPWYAFRVSPKQSGELIINMGYTKAAHRYRPKRSEDAVNWRLIDTDRISERGRGKKVKLRVKINDTPFIIAAQELFLIDTYDDWIDDIVRRVSLKKQTIGASVEDRPIIAVKSEPDVDRKKKEYVLFVGRQHPPEVTGAFAMLPFLETIFADTMLANKFRDHFHIIAVPLMNPDGVVRGHWRHNANGVDLNRDWGPFTQPETQAIKNLLDQIEKDESGYLRLMLDFHSTKRNVFYTQSSSDVTNPPKFAQSWLTRTRERLDGYEFERAERHQSDLPTSKNYVFTRFGAPAITYEVGDETDRELVRESARVFAEEMMENLLAFDSEPGD